jgi:hypothetical protein
MNVEFRINPENLERGQWLRDLQKNEGWNDAETLNVAAQMIDQFSRLAEKLPEIVLTNFLKGQTVKRIFFQRDGNGDLESALIVEGKKF